MEEPKPNERKLNRLKMPFVLRIQRLTAKDQWDFVLLEDICATGARFHSETHYLEGEVLNLKLHVSGAMSTILCRGEVVRVARLGQMETVVVAIIFIDLTQENADWITRVIEENKRNAPS